ncbi:uncharacterized protein PAC_10665 [Phialocephala subalpina]|uniref:J domain-containing protein n=1 Tax=Phialocephala subalpina TaxID=576137 RepID=A0A1L7X6Y4_9HELO|nr:uncharacterized protein PAC_10665 [Phialocephala subalpina]
MAPVIVEHDYYEILGISNSASIDVAKLNYRRLALERHPDKNKDEPGATAAFQLLAEAFQTIKDPEKRREYDKIWPNIRGKAREGKEYTQQKDATEDHNAEAAAAHRNKAAKAREDRLKRERADRLKEQETEKARKATEELQRQKVEREMADRVREQIRAAREAEKRRAEAEEKSFRNKVEVEADRLREEVRKMEGGTRRGEETQKRRTQAAEAERKKEAEARAVAVKKEEERRAHIQRLESHRAVYERELHEAEDRLDQLSIEIQGLQDLDREDAQWKGKKSGMAHVLDPSARAEHKREMGNRETRRLERDATRRIKTSQLEKQEKEVQKALGRLGNVNVKIAAAEQLQKEATQRRENIRKERTTHNYQADEDFETEIPNKTSATKDDPFGSAKHRRPPAYPRFSFDQGKTAAKEAHASSQPPPRPSFAKARRQTTDDTKDTQSPPSGQPKRDPPLRRATFASEPKASTQYPGASSRYFSEDEPPSPSQPQKTSFTAKRQQRETHRARPPYQSPRDPDPPRRAEPKKASSQYFARSRSPSPSPPPPPPRSFSYQDAPREEIPREKSPRRPVRADAPPRRATYDYEPRKASSQYFDQDRYDDGTGGNSSNYYARRDRSPSPIRVRPSHPPPPVNDRAPPRERRDEYPASSRRYEEGDRRDDRSYDRSDPYYDSRYNSYEDDDAIDTDDIQILLNGFEEMLRRRWRRRAAERGQR